MTPTMMVPTLTDAEADALAATISDEQRARLNGCLRDALCAALDGKIAAGARVLAELETSLDDPYIVREHDVRCDWQVIRQRAGAAESVLRSRDYATATRMAAGLNAEAGVGARVRVECVCGQCRGCGRMIFDAETSIPCLDCGGSGVRLHLAHPTSH